MHLKSFNFSEEYFLKQWLQTFKNDFLQQKIGSFYGLIVVNPVKNNTEYQQSFVPIILSWQTFPTHNTS